MRSKANSVLLVGPGGVGCTALCLGLEAVAQGPGTPFDIVNKRLFWLDTDGLFSSGNAATLNENFEKVLRQLSRYPDTLLIIEDMRDFVDATRNNGCTHFINALMRAVDGHKFQAIFESRDSDLEIVLKCHSNMAELYTMLDLAEPDAESLRLIVRDAVKALERHHSLPVDDEAVDTAIELTTKYRVRESSLSRAQPERSLNLLDRALTAYRQQAHTNPRGLAEKQAQLAEVARRARRAARSPRHSRARARRISRRCAPSSARRSRRSKPRGRRRRRRSTSCIATRRTARRRSTRSRISSSSSASATPSCASRPSRRKARSRRSSSRSACVRPRAATSPKKCNRIKAEIDKVQAVIQKEKAAFAALTGKINEGLRLKAEHVLAEFSQLSGIPVSKLNQDERAKLLNLDETLAARVFGQDHVVNKLADAVRVARVGLKDPQKPQASFMFLGPVGRRQDGAREGAHRRAARRRARAAALRHVGVHGEARGREADRRAAGLRGLRGRRNPHERDAPQPLRRDPVRRDREGAPGRIQRFPPGARRRPPDRQPRAHGVVQRSDHHHDDEHRAEPFLERRPRLRGRGGRDDQGARRPLPARVPEPLQRPAEHRVLQVARASGDRADRAARDRQAQRARRSAGPRPHDRDQRRVARRALQGPIRAGERRARTSGLFRDAHPSGRRERDPRDAVAARHDGSRLRQRREEARDPPGATARRAAASREPPAAQARA